ncbi:MAG: TonB family protein [Pseudomonadota bacterium]
MYADQRYIPRSPRSVSLGAALAINGLVIAALVSFVPDIIPMRKITRLEGTNIPIDPPPPEIVEVEKPVVETAQQPLIYVPPTVISQPNQPTLESTDVTPTEPPLPTIIDKPGPTVIGEPPIALPPLIGAQQDTRFARDYQPEYPSSELRAQRDGKVSIRVLIGTDGRVKSVEQVSATSSAFFEATKRQALGKWRFKPATRGGVPQESWKTMSVRFELNNA